MNEKWPLNFWLIEQLTARHCGNLLLKLPAIAHDDASSPRMTGHESPAAEGATGSPPARSPAVSGCGRSAAAASSLARFVARPFSRLAINCLRRCGLMVCRPTMRLGGGGRAAALM